jgi:phytanoyl-CoA hydroxylase
MTEFSSRVRASYPIKDPADFDILIPVDSSEDFPYFAEKQTDDISKYYYVNGYVVVRGLVPKRLCDRAVAMFALEVKAFRGFMYRQANGNPERHTLTPAGLMLNSILNVQSLNKSQFGRFQEAGLEILTFAGVQKMCEVIMGAPGTLVQSMFFEGNPLTWAHQDSYYLDGDTGTMTAVWIAAEDISPGAGRFFVYPKSHKINFSKNRGQFDIAFHHPNYKEQVIDVIRSHRLECRAPAMRAGDALFWSSKTIHGSLVTLDPRRSRCSFSAHYIPEGSRLLQFQTRIRKLEIATVNGMRVHRPKDLNKRRNRTIMWVAARFPTAFEMCKRVAIKLLTH